MPEDARRRPARVIDHADALDLSLPQLAPRPPEVRVLMADPAFFDVEYVINPHMEGHVGTIDRVAARAQWGQVRNAYRRIGYPVEVIKAAAGLPDLVFTANQSFPGQLPNGRWVALMSNMYAPQRRREVDLVRDWYARRGALTLDLPSPGLPFEGMGDAAWVPGRRAVVGGHGFRTDRQAYDHISAIFDVPVLALRLVDDRFYHLDTCLQLIDDATALYVPTAFDDAGRALLAKAFPRLVAVPEHEALGGLACNGHCPNGRHFIVHQGATATLELVAGLGLVPIEVDTGEFLKSGGSVYCMKLMIP
jgi:N-dimethylarginine dimethylaminohydrolase